MSDPRPLGVFDSGVGGLTVLREIIRRSPGRVDRLSRRQRTRPIRRPFRRRGARFQHRVARPPRRTGRQGHRRRLQHLDGGRARRPPTALRPADPGRHPAGRLGCGAGDPEPAGRGDRDAGDHPVARLLRGHQGREPGRGGLRARDAGARPAGRGRRAVGRDRRGGRRGCPRAAHRGARRRRRLHLPEAAGSDDRHAPPRLHALPAAAAAHRREGRGPGRHRRLGDRDRLGSRRAARASTVSKRPEPRGHGRRPGIRGHDRPAEDGPRTPSTSS